MTPIPIEYRCSTDSTGYGIAARGYVECLKALNVENLSVLSTLTSTADDEDRWAKEFMPKGNIAPGINIVHMHPPLIPKEPSYWKQTWYNIAVTTWEYDRLPKKPIKGSDDIEGTITAHLNRFEQVWVPTERVRKLFVDSGVVTPVHVIPHALLPELLAREPKQQVSRVPDLHPSLTSNTGQGAYDLVRFYYIGSWSERKNVSALLEAYFSTGWNPSTPVQLELHCVPPSRDPDDIKAHNDLVHREVGKIRDATEDPYSLPAYGTFTQPRPYADILDMHERNHVFVTASRGEGFGLGAQEAAAMGNQLIGTTPVISHLGLDNKTHFVVNHQSQRATSDKNYLGFEIGMRWDEPDIDDLIGCFHDMLMARKEAAGEKPGSAGYVRDRFSVDTVKELVRDRLTEAELALCGGPSAA